MSILPVELLPSGNRHPRLRAHPAIAGVIALCAGGAAAAWTPAAGLIFVAAALGLVAADRPRLPHLFLGVLAPLLIGYAFFSRGFAHIGAPPIYIGEVVLVLAALVLLVGLRGAQFGTVGALLVAFMGLGAVRTIPFVETFGAAALRDATLWGYAIFALALSVCVRIEHVERLVAVYRRAIPWFLVWTPVGLVAAHLYAARLPTFPGSSLPILSLKGGDAAVHLSGAACFLLLGLGGRSGSWRRNALWGLWFVGAGVVASANRGGFVALALSVTGALLMRATARRRVRFLGIGALVLTVVLVFNPTVNVGTGRSASLRQLGLNALSITGSGGDATSAGTRNFRLEWWRKIENYTFHGSYFWGGKGFGINLADDDGFQPTSDHSLRAPHNTHVTILARMGVPGLALWLLLQGSFAGVMLAAAKRARRNRSQFWARFDSWILLYWLAMLVNTSFDPYLEGPQGSIWFWSVFGVGLAALRLQREGYA